MRWEDLKASIGEFWYEFRREPSGIAGLALLLLFVGIAVGAPLLAPPEASTRWRDITYWEGLPRSAPPEWINLFSSRKLPPHLTLTNPEVEVQGGGAIRRVIMNFSYDFQYDDPPTDLMVYLTINLTDAENPPTMVVSIVRPDGQKIQLYNSKLRSITPGKRSRILVTAEDSAVAAAMAFGRKYETPENMDKVLTQLLNPLQPIFSEAQPGMMLKDQAVPLKGRYIINVQLFLFNPGDEVQDVRVTMAGEVYGLLGTDNNRRDLYAGLIWGTQVSLVVGVVTSILSTGIGVILGVLAAYVGGWWDEGIGRVTEIVASIPVLPLLIIIFSLWKPSIWPVIILMGILGWSGTQKVVRSMGFQLKEATYVDAARALGARAWWIISRHMVPQILPYLFASIALSVPGYILLEAGLSFLGLGDATKVTWGQILHDAEAGAATIKGMWWWVIPPGVAIMLVGLSFALLGTALNRILSPKMRTL